MDNGELESRMDRIIEWVKACDTKASIVLALVSLMLSFVFTSDFVLEGLKDIFSSVLNYDSDNKSILNISLSGLLTILFLLASVYFLMGSIYRFVMVVYSKPQESLDDSKKMSIVFRLFNCLFRYKWRNLHAPNTKKDSLIHLNHIASLSYEQFKKDINSNEYDETDDYLSQIYINSQRCSEKFDDYNSGIRWMLRALPCLIVFFVSLLIYAA